MPKRIIVGISGASGVVYGIRALQMLSDLGAESHLIISKSAQLTLAQEHSMSLSELKSLAQHSYAVGDVGATISSGSFVTDGMLIAPCSIRTMSEIATGVTSTLLTRAADVVLKERRRLVLMVRETPLHTGHLRTMTSLSELGAVIAPPVPAFYAGLESVEAMVDQSVGRCLDLFGFESREVLRWQGLKRGE